MNGFNVAKEIGRSFIISSLIPSALFVFMVLLLILGFLPEELLIQIETYKTLQIISGASITVAVLWISLFLYSSTDWVLKVYEGYYFPKWIRNFMCWLLIKELRKNTKSYNEIRQITNKPINKRTIEDEERYRQLWSTAMGELAQLGWIAPFNEEDIMPTRFGNILRATEVYAYERYLIEASEIWPRLWSLLPENYLKEMEEKINKLTFVLNSSLLLSILGLISALIGVLWSHTIFSWISTVLFLGKGFTTVTLLIYWSLSFILWFIGYILYRVAVNTALDFGLLYRTGIDLYRFELLKKLNYKLPEDLGDELNLWLQISTFFIAGNKLNWDRENLLSHPYYFENSEKTNVKQKRKKA